MDNKTIKKLIEEGMNLIKVIIEALLPEEKNNKEENKDDEK